MERREEFLMGIREVQVTEDLLMGIRRVQLMGTRGAQLRRDQEVVLESYVRTEHGETVREMCITIREIGIIIREARIPIRKMGILPVREGAGNGLWDLDPALALALALVLASA